MPTQASRKRPRATMTTNPRYPFNAWIATLPDGEQDAIALARRFSIQPSYVYALRNQSATPGSELRVLIARASDGAVAFDSWKLRRRRPARA